MSLMIPDAFLQFLSIVPQSTNYANMAIRQMADLRLSTLFRGRAVVAPDPTQLPIPAYQTFKTQVRLIPNSYVWGISWTQPDIEINDGSEVAISITDTCTGLDFFEDFVIGNAFFNFFITSGFQGVRSASSIPYLLSKPKLIQDPGLLEVQISNRLTTGINGQLVLFVSEPAIRENIQTLSSVATTQGYTANAKLSAVNTGNGDY